MLWKDNVFNKLWVNWKCELWLEIIFVLLEFVYMYFDDFVVFIYFFIIIKNIV